MSGAGRYRHFVKAQRVNPSATKTAAQEIDKSKDENWETFAERWMEIIPEGGGETTGAQVEAFRKHTVKTRYDTITATIAPEHRLLYGARRLNITSVVITEEARKEIVMKCTEAV